MAFWGAGLGSSICVSLRVFLRLLFFLLGRLAVPYFFHFFTAAFLFVLRLAARIPLALFCFDTHLIFLMATTHQHYYVIGVDKERASPCFLGLYNIRYVSLAALLHALNTDTMLLILCDISLHHLLAGRRIWEVRKGFSTC